MANDCSSSDWSSLPKEILKQIGEKLPVDNQVHFTLVCKSWQASLPIHHLSSPWLLVPNEPEELEYKEDVLTFYSVAANKFFKQPVAGITGWHCVGSQDGWLAMSDNKFNLCLLNPITGARIELPPFYNHSEFEPVYDGSSALSGFRVKHGFGGADDRKVWEFKRKHCVVKKIVFASNPTPTSVFAMAIYFDLSAAYIKPGDTKWTAWSMNGPMGAQDIVFHDGKFWILAFNEGIFSFDPLDVDKEPASTGCVIGMPERDDSMNYNSKCIFVSKSKHLFMLTRSAEEGTFNPLGEEARWLRNGKLRLFQKRGHFWYERKGLKGDECFFVGNNNAFSLNSSSSQARGVGGGGCIFVTNFLSHEAPLKSGIFPRSRMFFISHNQGTPQAAARGGTSCIFGINLFSHGPPLEMGIFDPRKGKIDPLIQSGNLDLNWQQPPPIWFQPRA